MSVPGPWIVLLLLTAGWRTWTLMASDTILDGVRDRIFFRYGPRGGKTPRNAKALTWLECPYCAGFWNVIVWYAAWQLWPHATAWVAALFALSAGLILLEAVLSWLGGE